MTGKDFMDRLHAAFPDLLAALFGGGRPGRERDQVVAGMLDPLASWLGATITPEVVAKARLRHGVAAYRQTRPKRTSRAIAEYVAAQLPAHLDPAAPAPQALGPQARSLFEEREPETGPPIPEPKGLDLSDESAAKVAQHLFRLMRENAGTSAEVAC